MPETPEDMRTEIIPAVRNATSGLASANAPIILIDEFPTSGYYNGIAHITCEAVRFLAVNGVAVNDRVVVAHLRMNMNGLRALKGSIATIERMLERDGIPLEPLKEKI